MTIRVLRSPRSRISLLFGAVVASAVAVACSGTPVEKADLGLDTTRRVPENPDNPPSTPNPSDTSTPADAAAPPTTNDPINRDAGEPTVIDGGDVYEGGLPCVKGGAVETEPNDDATSASELAPTICGGVIPGTESDFLKFTLKDRTRSFWLDFAGNVSLTVTVNGETVTITPQSSPPLKVVKNKEYTVEVRSMDQQRQLYRVTLFET